MENETKQKKSLKWLWISIAIAIVVGIAVWCGISASSANGVESTFKFSSTFVLFATAFIIVALGYLLGGITIKGVNLGTAGVFLMAILVGFLCTLDFGDVPLLGPFHVSSGADPIVETMGGSIQNIGLILFVAAVGFIAGPNFFKNLKKNFKTYILLGVVIILAGTAVAVICSLLTSNNPVMGSEFWAGVLSGALTSTPGYSAAVEAADVLMKNYITIGHAIAYPFGVVGVVLFVQLIPKFLKANMEKERQLIKIGTDSLSRKKEGLFVCDSLGLMPFALAVVAGLLLGSITIPLSGAGYNGPCFSLGTTGGVLIMCLIFGHFGNFGKLSLHVPEHTTKVLREFGLMLFLLGAGFEGGVNLVSAINEGGVSIVLWGLLGGAIMTITPMIVGFFLGKKVMKLPLLNNLGSITGGMTSTPALGTLISTAETEDVASAYASTYPIALVLIVLACNLMVGLI